MCSTHIYSRRVYTVQLGKKGENSGHFPQAWMNDGWGGRGGGEQHVPRQRGIKRNYVKMCLNP
jgi:hypothetical protein